MAWLKVDDVFPECSKVEAIASKYPKLLTSCITLWLFAGCFCARNRTDGRISEYQLRRLVPTIGNISRQLEALVDVRFFDKTDEGYLLHNYLKYNFSKDDIERKKEEKAERQKRYLKNRKSAPVDASLDALLDRLQRRVATASMETLPHPNPSHINLSQDRGELSPREANTVSPPNFNLSSKPNKKPRPTSKWSQFAEEYARFYESKRGLPFDAVTEHQKSFDKVAGFLEKQSLKDGTSFTDAAKRTLDNFFNDDYCGTIDYNPALLAKQTARFFNPPPKSKRDLENDDKYQRLVRLEREAKDDLNYQERIGDKKSQIKARKEYEARKKEREQYLAGKR